MLLFFLRPWSHSSLFLISLILSFSAGEKRKNAAVTFHYLPIYLLIEVHSNNWDHHLHDAFFFLCAVLSFLPSFVVCLSQGGEISSFTFYTLCWNEWSKRSFSCNFLIIISDRSVAWLRAQKKWKVFLFSLYLLCILHNNLFVIWFSPK